MHALYDLAVGPLAWLAFGVFIIGSIYRLLAMRALALKKELKEDVCSIDHVIPFFESEEGAKVLGADTAKNLAKAAHEAKDKGVKYCICPACTAGGWLLDHASEW